MLIIISEVITSICLIVNIYLHTYIQLTRGYTGEGVKGELRWGRITYGQMNNEALSLPLHWNE
jgi:hypothetical protein